MKLGNSLGTAGVFALSLIASGAPQTAKAGGPEPFIGEMILVAFNFCPDGYLPADGRLLSIFENTALFSLYGTTFGGDGIGTFALPDMRDRAVIGTGAGPGLGPVNLGQISGTATKTMTQSTLPSHRHLVNVNNLDGDKGGPGGKLLAAAPAGGTGNETIYSTEPANVTMSPAMIAPAGASTPISTQDPWLGLLHCIAQYGIYPSRP